MSRTLISDNGRLAFVTELDLGWEVTILIDADGYLNVSVKNTEDDTVETICTAQENTSRYTTPTIEETYAKVEEDF